MPGDAPRKPAPRDLAGSDDIPEQPTRREEVEPSNQIVLDSSDFVTAGDATHRTGARIGMPEKIGQYQIIRELGRGGMGVVYLARQPSLNREVALKVLNINLQGDPEDAERFRTEAKLAAALRHPNIVQIHEIGEQDGYAFMALEYVPGGSLHQRLQVQPLTPRQAAELLEPIARAMQHAHNKGIIHRDLKPGNILLTAEQGTLPADSKTARNEPLHDSSARKADSALPTPKITDFGLAKNLNQSMHLTATGVALGTPSYMAPEQARDDRKHIGPLSDVYALGAILYEMLAGKPPFVGSSALVTMQQVVRARPVPPSDMRPAVPKELEKICLKCLEKLPKNRFARAQDLADALRAFLDGPPPQPVAPEKRWRWSLSTVLASAGAMLAIVFAIKYYIAAGTHESQARSARDDARSHSVENESLRNSAGELHRQQIDSSVAQASLLGEQGHVDHAAAMLSGLLLTEEKQLSGEQTRSIRISLAEWNDQSVRPVATAKQPSRVNALVWSPDGKLLAAAGEDGHVRFFTSDGGESGKSILCPDAAFGGSRAAHSLAWSPKGDLLAVGGSFGRVYLGDPAKREATGEPIKPDDLARSIWQVHFANAGKTLVTASQDGGVRIFDFGSRAWLAEPVPREEAGSYISLAVSSDGKLLASGGKSGNLRVWELKDKDPKELRAWKVGGEIRALAFSPDQRCLVAGTKSGSLFLCDRIADHVIDLPTEGSSIVRVGFSPDGQFIAASTEAGSVRLWDACSHQPLGQPFALEYAVRGLAFHPTESKLAIGDDRGEIRILSVPHTCQVAPPVQLGTGVDHEVHGVAYSHNGYRFLAVSHAGARLWSVGQDWKEIALTPYYIVAGALHPDGNQIAATGHTNMLRLVEADDAKESSLRTTGLPENNAGVVRFNASGDRLLVIAKNPDGSKQTANSARIIHLPALKPADAILVDFPSPVNDAVWFPDGERIAIACGDGSIRIWDCAKNALQSVQFVLGSSVQCLALNANSSRLAAGGLNGSGKFWNVEDGREVGRSINHLERIVSIAFSPDGKTVLTASHDKTARYWDAQTGWPLGPPRRHPEAVLSVVFHPEGKHSVTGCRDGTLRFWRLPLPPIQDTAGSARNTATD